MNDDAFEAACRELVKREALHPDVEFIEGNQDATTGFRVRKRNVSIICVDFRFVGTWTAIICSRNSVQKYRFLFFRKFCPFRTHNW